MDANGKHVLVLGGTGFMGRATVRALNRAGYTVSVLNRGRGHWDADGSPFAERVPSAEEPHASPPLRAVRELRADRDHHEQTRRVLASSLPDGVARWHGVVDFSAFAPPELDDVVAALGEARVGHYVFISSDSVYMVCKRRVAALANAAAAASLPPCRESDAVRPDDERVRARLRDEDDYGDDKLLCEEQLAAATAANDFRWTALRLPDVVGPYDRTDRHWNYQLWLRAALDVGTPCPLPAATRARELSFVYSEDVASAVVATLAAGAAVHSRALNIGCVERPTLETHLRTIARLLVTEHGAGATRPSQGARRDSSPRRHSPRTAADARVDSVRFDTHTRREYYPSVETGPVDVSLARELLGAYGWRPTPYEEMMRATVAFFERAWRVHPDERPDDLDIPVDALRALERTYPGITELAAASSSSSSSSSDSDSDSDDDLGDDPDAFVP